MQEESDEGHVQRDDFDEFDTDMTDVREFDGDSPEAQAGNQPDLWVNGLRRIAKQQVSEERAERERQLTVKH